MMKKVIAACICMGLGSSLYASEEGISTGDRILGIEVGGGKIQASTIYSPVPGIAEYDHESSDVEFGVRLGAEKKDWKTLLVVNYYDNTDDDQKYIKGLLEVDYFLLQEEGLKPYLGLNVGYMNYESTNIDEGGFLYGAQVGVQYRVMENIEADLVYRYSWSNMDQVDHVEGIIFGLSYIF